MRLGESLVRFSDLASETLANRFNAQAAVTESRNGNASLFGRLYLMDYTRMDIVLIILTTIAVAIFLGYLAFGPDELIPTSVQ
jgi:hypothetical protein